MLSYNVDPAKMPLGRLSPAQVWDYRGVGRRGGLLSNYGKSQACRDSIITLDLIYPTR